MNGHPRLPYSAHLFLSTAVMIVAIWLSTGTMAPYAATLQYPLILEPCHYLANVDHLQFEAVSAMIAGLPPEYWSWSVVLRRVLFPIISYPLVRALGFLAGGALASVILHVAALIVFAEFVRKRVGVTGAVVVAWLLATYPGITYWAGLPYSYVMIVPGSLFCFVLLYRIIDAGRLGDLVWASFLMGIVFTGYDLLPFFGAAVILSMIVRRRFASLIPAVCALMAPTAMVALMFLAMGVPLLNSNTANFVSVIFAWLHPFADLHGWFGFLTNVPLVFATNFLFGNLVVLPVLFLAAWLTAKRRRLAVMTLAEGTLLAAALALFLFANLAPPYYGWQMRGHWLARLYQPVFPAYLMIIARLTEALNVRDGARWRMALVLAGVLNASIAFGPVLMNPLAGWVYERFYTHSTPGSLMVNLQRFGRRPWGLCSVSHRWDGVKDPNTPFNRPAYMYRYDDRSMIRLNNQ